MTKMTSIIVPMRKYTKVAQDLRETANKEINENHKYVHTYVQKCTSLCCIKDILHSSR